MITFLGLFFILVGMFVGLSSPIPYNGQWLLGFLIAFVGLAVAARNSK